MVDTKALVKRRENTIPDITICHDPALAGYTPPELLSKRYPSVFDPKLFDGEQSGSLY